MFVRSSLLIGILQIAAFCHAQVATPANCSMTVVKDIPVQQYVFELTVSSQNIGYLENFEAKVNTVNVGMNQTTVGCFDAADAVDLAADGSIVAVGVITNQEFEGPNGNPNARANVVRVFRINGSTRSQIGNDIQEDVSGHTALDLNEDGTVLAVERNDGVQVYRYNRTTNVWEALGGLIEAGGHGLAMAKSVIRVAVSNSFNNGGVSIYDWDEASMSWDREAFLRGGTGDGFGVSIALSNDGSVLVVGADTDINKHGEKRGTVIIYERRVSWYGGGWEFRDVLDEEPSELAGNRFGKFVGVSANGRVVIVGAPNSNRKRGFAHVYVASGDGNLTRWQKVPDSLTGDKEGDELGFAVAVNEAGTLVAAGSLFNVARENYIRVASLSCTDQAIHERPDNEVTATSAPVGSQQELNACTIRDLPPEEEVASPGTVIRSASAPGNYFVHGWIGGFALFVSFFLA